MRNRAAVNISQSLQGGDRLAVYRYIRETLSTVIADVESGGSLFCRASKNTK